jgi:hypothetical protein
MSNTDKDRAFNRIRQAIITGDSMKGEELEGLLPFFAPRMPAQAKTSEQWVKKAVGKKDHRSWVNFMYSHEGYLYATDGHRAHKAPTDLPSGCYDPASMLKVEDNDAQITQLVRMFDAAQVAPLVAIVREGVDNSMSRKVCHMRFEAVGATFDKKYLMDASNRDVTTRFLVENNKARGFIGFGEFIVMGIMT